jgi:hypothetical protein
MNDNARGMPAAGVAVSVLACGYPVTLPGSIWSTKRPAVGTASGWPGRAGRLHRELFMIAAHDRQPSRILGVVVQRMSCATHDNAVRPRDNTTRALRDTMKENRMVVRSMTLTAAMLALPLLATPALAQDAGCGGPINAMEALRIATGAGVAQIRDLECDDGKWEVKGRDANGGRIEVDINPTSGAVIKVERERR